MKVRKLLTLLLCLTLLLSLLSGCGGASQNTAAMDRAPAEAPAARPEMDMLESGSMAGSTGGSTALPENRKWIVTVDIHAETEDLDTLLADLDKAITDLGGYVEGQNIYNGSTYADRRYRSASLTVRIPAQDVDRFTGDVEGISNVVRKNKNLEDITLTYVDTESHLAALQLEEARLMEFMEQAETMADLLEIEARLTDVRYELESYTSRLRTYDNQIDYATIYLDIEEVQEYTPVAERTAWQRISEGFVSSVKDLIHGVKELCIWMLVNSPYLVIYGVIAAAAVLGLKRLRRGRAAKKTAKTEFTDKAE